MMAYMILGGQWGSEGKGLFAGYMARMREPDAVVCQFGPNAGHTWIEGDTPIVFKSLPVASIAPSVQTVLLGPGCVINPARLKHELAELDNLMKGKQVYVHEAAAIVNDADVAREGGAEGVSHIASTMQGTAEAMIRKIRRPGYFESYAALEGIADVISHREYRQIVKGVKNLQIEGAQGMDLSINCGHTYPFTTSRDCTPAQVLADCGLHPRDLFHIYACIRTYPIRVGNIMTYDGKPIGHSGPHYPDQREMTWEELGQTPELTTVTKRVRRVFSFSFMQIKKLLDEVQPDGIFLNFANYMQPEPLQELVDGINREAKGPIVRWAGFGPKASDIKTYGMTGLIAPEYGE